MSGAAINAVLFDIIDSDAAFRSVHQDQGGEDAAGAAVSSDPSEMTLVDKVVDGISLGQLEGHLSYLNNYRDPAFCELYLALRREAAGMGIPDVLLYLAALRFHVSQTWRGTTLMWPFEFAHWLEFNWAKEREDDDGDSDSNSRGSAQAGRGQLLREYTSRRREDWEQFTREWNSRVRPLLMPALTGKVTASAQNREMKRRLHLRTLGPCPVLDFDGIEYAQIVDTLPLTLRGIVPTLARRMREIESSRRPLAVPPVELARHMAHMIVALRALSTTVASEVQSYTLPPVATPARHEDMLSLPELMTKWKDLGSAVIAQVFETFAERDADGDANEDEVSELEIAQWEQHARGIAGELLEVQSIVSRVFSEKYHAMATHTRGEDALADDQEIPTVPDLLIMGARIDDATNSQGATNAEIASILEEFSAGDLRELQDRLRQQFDTTTRQIQIHNSRQSGARQGSSALQRRHSAFIRLWRQPGMWQSVVQDVFSIVSSRLRSPSFGAFGMQMCSLLVQAHLQGPRMQVKLPLVTYVRTYNKRDPTWGLYSKNAPVRETLGAKVAAIVVVWPGLVDQIRGESQESVRIQSIDSRVDAPLPHFDNSEGIVLWKLR